MAEAETGAGIKRETGPVVVAAGIGHVAEGSVTGQGVGEERTGQEAGAGRTGQGAEEETSRRAGANGTDRVAEETGSPGRGLKVMTGSINDPGPATRTGRKGGLPAGVRTDGGRSGETGRVA